MMLPGHETSFPRATNDLPPHRALVGGSDNRRVNPATRSAGNGCAGPPGWCRPVGIGLPSTLNSSVRRTRSRSRLPRGCARLTLGSVQPSNVLPPRHNNVSSQTSTVRRSAASSSPGLIETHAHAAEG